MYYSKFNSVEPILDCPICTRSLRAPIIQCQTGHSMCQDCTKSCEVTKCPTCSAAISHTRNFLLEEVLAGFKSVVKEHCCYFDKGCRYYLHPKDKYAHEKECRYRRYVCEGKNFAGWQCDWSGQYLDIYQHFQDAHSDKSAMQYSTETNIPIDLTKDSYDLRIISFFNGQNFFYYKHKIDVARQKAYWTFQMIGLQNHAEHYMYEFEIYSGPFRNFKVIDVCDNDTVDTEAIFEQERCVVISFPALYSFLNKDGDLFFRFRIKTLKKISDCFPPRRSFDGFPHRRSIEYNTKLSTLRRNKSE